MKLIYITQFIVWKSACGIRKVNYIFYVIRKKAFSTSVKNTNCPLPNKSNYPKAHPRCQNVSCNYNDILLYNFVTLLWSTSKVALCYPQCICHATVQRNKHSLLWYWQPCLESPSDPLGLQFMTVAYGCKDMWCPWTGPTYCPWWILPCPL